MKVYYAHSISIYNTMRETRDISLLEDMGFEVVNPNGSKHEREYLALKERTGNGMPYFDEVISNCHVLAFRSNPDGSISSGIAKEIETARDQNIPIIELPSSIERRTMTIAETREYLVELGVR